MPGIRSNFFRLFEESAPLLSKYSKEEYTMDFQSQAINRLGELKENISISEHFQPTVQLEFDQTFNEKHKLLIDILSRLEDSVIEIQTDISRGETEDFSREIAECKEKYFKTLRSVKPKFDELEKLVTCLKDDSSQPLEYQKRLHSFQLLSRQLKNVMDRFDGLKEAISKRNHDKIKRTLEINGVAANDQEIDDMIDSNDYAMLDAVAEISKKKEALRAIEERHNILLKLESTIRDLSELFYELNLKIMENQEDIDRIELNYTQAHDYISSGNEQLLKAVNYRESSLKKQITCAVIVIVIVAILVLIIWYNIRKKN